MSGEAGNGQRTNNTVLLALAALLGSSGWAYAGLAGGDTKEVRDSINRHDGDLRLLRYQVDFLIERERERDRRLDD